ncbi:FtsW/RodA/SpoVE family cell cycle protein [Paenibacillus illinoisensis]|uniref:FtsW/RodA/SpoVE family cell cycle protein n=1 Tax=Paenibacillus illinoisensis TaxID=59845 RepID=UPI00203D2F70|nr:FtsW/RodA/SpoVE family cell cycle protein [Paenibacillus illinoisensis]MCM3207952.1 FtsW/RodA/SpoVE family cell cycle protein [Paenibacillus illinoisensis]
MWRMLKKMDGVILFVLFLLMIASVFAIYSGTQTDAALARHHIKTMLFYIVGFVAVVGIGLVNYKLYVKYAFYLYALGIVLLVLVNFVGGPINNANGWIKLGDNLSFQPAELFKMILILFLAHLLVKRQRNTLGFWRDIIPIGCWAFVPFALVMIQNDLGNALGYVVILAAVLWIGNIKLKHAIIGLVIVAVTFFGFVKAYMTYHDEIFTFLEKVGREHWAERIDPWLVPEKATSKATWHTKNAGLAIGSGGIIGKGYLQGTSVQSGRVPYTYSDSIFVVIAEEFGFVGASVLLLLYFILIHRMVLIGMECKDRAGPVIIVGIIGMLLYQVFENIGAFLGLMPLTGITLPFISYGGTSLLINMACIGLVMSIKLYGDEEEDDLLLGEQKPGLPDRLLHLLRKEKSAL